LSIPRSRQLKERAIDVLIIDPFVSCHRVTENDNNAIDAVTKAWASVAHAANCAIELVHHVRKGEQEVTVESARGGGSFGDACRMVRVINRMTKEDAQKAGVDNHRLYFRTYIDKNNLAPPADKSDWYQLVSVDLGNGPLGPVVGGGDSIGVVTKWEWPHPLEGITGRDFERVVAQIRAGEWRESQQATRWVGIPVANALSLKLTLKQDRARVVQSLQAVIRSPEFTRGFLDARQRVAFDWRVGADDNRAWSYERGRVFAHIAPLDRPRRHSLSLARTGDSCASGAQPRDGRGGQRDHQCDEATASARRKDQERDQ
jgi:AAA domain